MHFVKKHKRRGKKVHLIKKNALQFYLIAQIHPQVLKTGMKIGNSFTAYENPL